jgi:hypothetical protein
MALLLPPGWRGAKEQKKLESLRERERERDDKGDCVPRRHKSRKNGTKIEVTLRSRKDHSLSVRFTLSLFSGYIIDLAKKKFQND